MTGSLISHNSNQILAPLRKPQSVSRGIIILSAGQASVVFAHATINIIIARALSPEAYGGFGTVFFFLSWVISVLTAIILPGLKKVVSEEEQRYRAALTFATKWYSVAVLFLALLFSLMPPILSRAFGDSDLKVLFLLVGLQIPFLGICKLGENLLSGIRRFAASTLIKFTYALASVLWAGVFLLVGWGAEGAMGGIFAGTVLAAIVSIVLLVTVSRTDKSHLSYPLMTRRVIHWTSASLPATLGVRTLMTLDIWLLKAMSEYPAAAGFYMVAYSLSRFPMILVEGLCGAVFPRVSQALEQGDLRVAQMVSSEAMRFLMMFLVPICFITAGCSGEIVAFVFSAKYAEAASSLRILCPAILFIGQLTLCWRLISATNRPEINLVIIYGLLGLGTGLNILLIPRLGMSGAAYASFLTFGIGAVAGSLLLYRFLKVLPPHRTAIRCGLAGLIVYVLATVWPVFGWVLIGKLLILLLLYCMMLWLLGELDKGDLLTIRHAFLR